MDILPFLAWYPNLDKIDDPELFLNNVKVHFSKYYDTGHFKKMPRKAIYIYRIQSPRNSYLGLLTAIPVEEYTRGNILKHEKTLVSKEKKTIELLSKRKANVKPILLTYPAIDTVDELLKSYVNKHLPTYSIHTESEQAIHQVWAIDNPQLIASLQNTFKKNITTAFIADGHHRTAIMSRLQEKHQASATSSDFSQLLVALFSSKQLKIYEFNRVVEGLTNSSPNEFLAAIQSYGTVQLLPKAKKPRNKHELTLFLDNQWYAFKWKSEVINAYQDVNPLLDVQLLNEKILKNTIGIQDVRLDARIKYVAGNEGLKGLKKATKKSPNNIGFYLYPVQFEELKVITEKGQLLPPKSTYFEPRMKNGLIIRLL